MIYSFKKIHLKILDFYLSNENNVNFVNFFA